MSRLLEIAIKNSLVNEQIDFNPDDIIRKRINVFSRVEDINTLPIDVKKASWETIEDNEKIYLTKTYTFMTEKHLLYFLNESIRKSNIINHHPKIIIENNQIKIESFTHDMNDVSHLDIELTKFMDEVYDDIIFLNRK